MNDLVGILKSAADTTRLRILHLIDARGPELCVCDLTAALELPQSTVSRQLMRLRHLGLVRDRRDGMWINYSLNADGDKTRSALIACLRECWQGDGRLARDLKKFDRLHAENKIVRCKRGEAMAKPNAGVGV